MFRERDTHTLYIKLLSLYEFCDYSNNKNRNTRFCFFLADRGSDRMDGTLSFASSCGPGKARAEEGPSIATLACTIACIHAAFLFLFLFSSFSSTFAADGLQDFGLVLYHYSMIRVVSPGCN